MRFILSFMTMFLTGTTLANLGENYQTLKAQEKREMLWENLSAPMQLYPLDKLPTSGPSSLSLLKLFLPHYLVVSFTHESDELPEGREKLIHTYGAVALVRFEPNEESSHPYTGLFKEWTLGLIRLSLAKQSGSYTPGLALKLLVDGRPSVNIVAMPSLDGQGDNRNFFALPFSTKLAKPTAPELGLLEMAFQKAIWKLNPNGSARHLPVDHAARIKADGSQVEGPTQAPDVLVFYPTKEVQLDPHSPEDMRISVSRFKEDTVLFEVLAKDAQEKVSILGKIVLDSKFVSGKYGDETLFFQHFMNTAK